MEAVERCRQLGRPFLVVSNNASESPERILAKFRKLGFEMDLEEIVSSGMAVKPYVENTHYKDRPYLLIGTPESAAHFGPDPDRLLVNPPDGSLKTDLKPAYVLICSNRNYYGFPQQEVVERELAEGPLPLLVANPDIVVHNDQGEPEVVAGFTADELEKRYGCQVIGLGKPFSPVYGLALEHYPDITPERILMVGDSLTTDILGGVAMGFSTCLTLSGLHGKEGDRVESLCREWAIHPDFIVSSIGS